MPEIYELRITADGVVKDADGNIIPPPAEPEATEEDSKPETEESA